MTCRGITTASPTFIVHAFDYRHESVTSSVQDAVQCPVCSNRIESYRCHFVYTCQKGQLSCWHSSVYDKYASAYMTRDHAERRACRLAALAKQHGVELQGVDSSATAGDAGSDADSCGRPVTCHLCCHLCCHIRVCFPSLHQQTILYDAHEPCTMHHAQPAAFLQELFLSFRG
jgi:hypothetical protein